MNKLLTGMFMFLFCMLSSICYAEVQMKLTWEPFNNYGIMMYRIQNRGDQVTITGYRINRGNTQSLEQQDAKGNFKFEPKTLKFGESTFLFTTNSIKDIIEVEIFTDKGNLKFELDN